ncbi:MAG: hypothetical protein HYV19_12795 [Gemmatimonadetes bacterium]|nr:hypothetical protein [Gemmatimonadota bacterium]
MRAIGRRFVSVTAGCVSLATSLHAQNLGTTVRVLDGRGAPVPHAVLDVGGSARIADDSGRIFMRFDSDSTTVRIRRMGFAPLYTRIPSLASTEVTVTLAGVAQPLAAVTVEAELIRTPLENAGFYDRVNRAQRGAYNAEFVAPEELDSRVMTRLSQAFQGRRFIKVAPAGQSASVLLGRANCAVTVLLDGQPMRDMGAAAALAPPGADPTAPKDIKGAARHRDVATSDRGHGRSFGLNIDEVASVGSVAAIEMYASSANTPVELLPYSSGCALVAIWTGSRH